MSLRRRISRLIWSQDQTPDTKPPFVPPGHFYSPIPSEEDVARNAQRQTIDRVIPGIDLRESDQLVLLHSLIGLYREQPFSAQPQPGFRYCFENPAYSYSDAIFLYCMLRHLRPRRVIEIGSGYSSCVMLDTSERFLRPQPSLAFIEPYPQLLASLLRPSESEQLTILPVRLQDVELDRFQALEANDILFVDSTHVSKVGSDVNRLIFEILPALQPGVHVHFHDIFYPFEYPQAWLEEGRAWNEIYILRAFLQYNRAFRVVLMNTFMEHFHAEFFEEHMPLCLKNPGGSLWIRKE